MVTVLASVKTPASVTLSSVTVSRVSVWPLAVDDSVPPPLTVAFSISLEVLTDSVPVSSMVPPEMVAPSSVTVLSMVTVLASVKTAGQRHIVERHRIKRQHLAGNGGRQRAAAIDGGVLDLA